MKMKVTAEMQLKISKSGAQHPSEYWEPLLKCIKAHDRKVDIVYGCPRRFEWTFDLSRTIEHPETPAGQHEIGQFYQLTEQIQGVIEATGIEVFRTMKQEPVHQSHAA